MGKTPRSGLQNEAYTTTYQQLKPIPMPSAAVRSSMADMK